MLRKLPEQVGRRAIGSSIIACPPRFAFHFALQILFYDLVNCVVTMASILCLLAAASLTTVSPVEIRQASTVTTTVTGFASTTVPQYFQTPPELFPRKTNLSDCASGHD